MTLLASERSMLIRSKFRSVLQLRMQHRRSQEQLSERHLIPALNKPLATFPQPSGTQNKANEIAKLKADCKASPRPHKTSTTKAQPVEVPPGDPSELQDKKARLAEDLSEKILHRPGPLELVKKNILPLDPGIKDAVTDATPTAPSSFNFEEDLSSSSSSSSPCFALSPGSTHPTSGTVFPLDIPPMLADQQPPGSSSTSEAEFPLQGGSPLTKPSVSLLKPPPKVPEARKPPRPKKVKEARPKVKKLKYHQYMPPDQKGEQAPVPMDAAYARLLQQQQVFLQLQILNQQQQPTPTSPATFCVQALHTVPASSAPEQVLSFPGTPTPPSGPPPLSLPSPATPTSPSPPKPELLPANLEELTVSELRQQLRKRGLPVSGTKPALLERLKPYQMVRSKPPPVPLSTSTRLAPSDLEEEAQALREKQRVAQNLALKLHREQKHQDDDLRVELEMHKRIKNRRKSVLPSTSQHGAPPPYIPQRECAKEGRGRDDGFMVLCPPSCEPIHSDMELPLEITASPADPTPTGTRSLEEELQEAIQKAQLVPSQSIEDILEEPLMCTDNLLQTHALTQEVPDDRVALSPLAHQEASPPKKARPSSDLPLVTSAIFDFPGSYDFLSTASSSSASLDSLSSVFSPDSLEMPPSPPDTWQGNGTRAGFDPVDWLEALTSGSASGLGSTSPVGGSIFCTDFFDSSDLGVNHMIDLMVEQW
ncbi:MEF2-activating motif and SAP domain-containing transcriptional regulator isoform X1 [Anolis carolinensis]|uniref:MEF2-activating motif and SAP domain-containing transcriptional regulator isoform X1 n=1 Tax=Anolis carolinensis TaxID=28377 RepID=UPI0004625E8B|nr:PREDICTED: MEF2-activating motif and SAP domain-containing transcriptional regulator isoform X1 [Anolis carolinensis]|eukprot:XP_008115413.1 PREDICTED: MEF2-activating motif and SAP domain-containing transcriptional regulator isoform X1 [Anolis carolinensis]